MVPPAFPQELLWASRAAPAWSLLPWYTEPCALCWLWRVWWHFLGLAISSHSICLFSSLGQKVFSVNYWETCLYQRGNDSQGLFYYSSSEPLHPKGDSKVKKGISSCGISGICIHSIFSTWAYSPAQGYWRYCLLPLFSAAVLLPSSFIDAFDPESCDFRVTWMTIQHPYPSVSWLPHPHWLSFLLHICHFLPKPPKSCYHDLFCA